MTKPIAMLIVLALSGVTALHAQTSSPLRLDAGVAVSMFQQQAKTEIGGERGDRLVEEFQIGVGIGGTYRLMDHLALGLFTRMDIGRRAAGRFDGFDSSGRAQAGSRLGGDYIEVWVGPIARASWRFLSAELGYAAIGTRSDDGRPDIASADGDTTSAFATSPAVAWMFTLGADLPLDEDLALMVKLEYRVRYYSSRGGQSLAGDIEHGTQSLVPMIGIAWTL